MFDRSTRIKNLAIALEALYRTPATAATYDVEKILDHEIQQHKKEQQQRSEPAKSSLRDEDDEIPF